MFCQEAEKKVKTVASHRAFKFGDGNIVHSFQRASLPAVIGNTKCNIETEIVKCDIPLLLSKSSLKKAGTILDLKNDQATMFERPVKLEFTSSGHYCINILKDRLENRNETLQEEEILEITGNMSSEEKKDSNETSQAVWTCII